MSGLPATSALQGVWGGSQNLPGAGPVPLGGGNPTGLPVINNSNLPPPTMQNVGNVPPYLPRVPMTRFPNIQPQFGGANNMNSNTYGAPQNFPTYNSYSPNLVCHLFFS
jgi:hypothetical protein